ncbi:hypothetical protein SCUCBS95973_005869 [Sporothrix curviconia]|uniref:Ubiquitin carboxyl-terminal hydrolase n=1 Tax=Sporothrix curviconia TaxID=1260050 RepID=A0ABP0C1F9_9PEZI
MSNFFGKLKPSAAAANAANNIAQNKKKDDPPLEQTPLEKMLLNAGPVRDDGTDKFFGLENFGNTCYCNSILQALYHSEPFRNNVVQFPPYSPADTPNGKPRKVNVQIRKPSDTATPPAPGTAAAAAAAAIAKKNAPPQPPVKGRQPITPGQPPNGPQPVRPEDKPDTPEYKKKQAMIKGPVLDLKDNASAYGMEESTFTSVKDIFMAWIESNSRTGVLSPHRLLEIFRKENELFRTAMHQDAHEFYGLVLNDIIKNVEETAIKRQKEDKDGLKKSVQAALSEAATLTDGTSTPGSGWVHDIFEGVLTSETRCLTCESASQRDETFLDLSIDLEEHSSVTSCLRKFSAEEMLCERNKFHCDHCGGLQEAEKRMKIKRLPKILALHLKRFKYSEDYTKLEKLFHRVVYPYQLRMFNTTDEAQDPDRLYELYAVVVHIGGNAYHGHYVSVIKTKERGWLLFDDEMVEPVDKHYVRNFFGDKPGTACAYVLFYQETTFEKMQAEQELEGLEEIRLANMSAGLALSPEEQHLRANGIQNGSGSLSRQVTQPAVASPADMREEFIGLEHARTAPGAVLTPISSAPNVPPMPSGVNDSSSPTAAPAPAPAPAPAAAAAAAAAASPAIEKVVSVNPKLEAARLKEEKEREKREAKAAEKARKVQEKENAKELERQRKEREKEREAQRKAGAEEMRRVIAASKQTAAEENAARKNSIDASASSGKASGFLNRGSRGSKSMSRKSFAFLGKDKPAIPESPFASSEHQSTSTPTAGASNVSTNGSSINSSTASTQPAAAPAAAPAQVSAPAPLPPLPEQSQGHEKAARKERFSFSIGRKKSNTFLP